MKGFYDSERFDRFETVMNLSYPVSNRSQGSEGLVKSDSMWPGFSDDCGHDIVSPVKRYRPADACIVNVSVSQHG